jgi:hypothetical protein
MNLNSAAWLQHWLGFEKALHSRCPLQCSHCMALPGIANDCQAAA